ncbi:putative ABC transport system permease protein [Thermoactinomyces sp. DSM 45891]|uniref:FtsX-like permease family protein n=1 Tax=Thermoactinomyces sp. DSM 45891 TaxID=1761907 RepID=UPI00091725B2|nr:FtsX-like permease family protein [Thermoactinomyces sp. DSM 45891]SFX07864.1 putative ABC transport system permease protein [Thermoactinomyces sp. DSM 45891]
MSFRQFALNNIRRNASTYIAYFLSSSFAVMIFFTYLVFINHPDILKAPTVFYGMTLASLITFFFSFLFILYSMSAFLKARLKEFGILTILGAQRKQLNYLIFLENIMIGTASVSTGMFCGLLFSKLFLLFGENILDLKLAMYLPMQAIWITVASFMALFLILSFMTTIFIRQRKALEIVQGSNRPKKEPKASIWLALLSAISLSCAVYLMTQDGNENIALAILFDIIGVYFFFTQLSVVIIRLLKKNRLFSWRGLNLLWITELAYKMKDNARMFFIITMVTTMACSTAGSVLAVQNYGDNTYTEDPFAYTISSTRKQDSTKNVISVTQKIEQTLRQKGIAYQRFSSNTIGLSFKKVGYIRFIRHTEYLEMAKALSLPLVSLQDREVLLFNSPLVTREDVSDKLTHLTFENQQLTSSLGKIKIKDHYTKSLFPSEYVAVVNDKTYDQMVHALSSEPDIIDHRYHYLIPSWDNHAIPDTNSIELKIGLELQKWYDSLSVNENELLDGYIDSRAQNHYTYKQLTSIAIFIGLFIVAIFSIFIASFLYFKLFIDLQHDQRYYHELSKMGLSLKEMKRAVTKQISILFYIPLFFAGIQTLVGLSTVNPLFSSKTNTLTSGLWALGIFTAIQTAYLLIVRARYLAQLKRVMV